MHRLDLSCRRAGGLAAAFACLLLAPAARADGGVTVTGDPVDLAALLAAAAMAGLPAAGLPTAALPAAASPALDPGVAPLPALPAPIPSPPDPSTIEPSTIEVIPPQAPAAPAISLLPDPEADSSAEPTTGLATEAGEAAAGVATEPHPITPPQPQPQFSQPAAGASSADGAVADASLASAGGAPVPEPQLAPAPPHTQPAQQQPAQHQPPQYQPAPPQYQPPGTAEAQTAPAAPAGAQSNWDWSWSCGGSQPIAVPAALPPSLSSNSLPRNWNWNWDWNCGMGKTDTDKNPGEVEPQYHGVSTQYHPINVNISIRIASPGENGPVTQTNIILAAALPPLAAAATTFDAALDLAQAPLLSTLDPNLGLTQAESSEPRPTPVPAATAAAASPGERAPAGLTQSARSVAERPTTTPSTAVAAPAPLTASRVAAPPDVTPWATTPVVPRRLRPAATDGHRGRPQLRRPTRRPLPPPRAPVFTAGSFGAAPLGGSDGGFRLALLLVPFALALVDSVRRTVRDTAPPVTSAHGSRRERPG